VLIAILIMSLVMVAFSAAFVKSTQATAAGRSRQVASVLADNALDQARALVSAQAPTGFLTGRTQSAVQSEWSAPPSGISLANMTQAYDSSANASSTAALPTTPSAQTVGFQTYKVYWFIGTCYQPLSTSTSSVTCTTGSTSGVQMYRILVAVTWTQSNGCGPGSCIYSSSTLLNVGTNPLFTINGSPSVSSTTTPSSTTTSSSTTTTTVPPTTTTTVPPTTTTSTTTTTTVPPTTTTSTTTTVPQTTTTTQYCLPIWHYFGWC
jgi:hypothetical protein